MGPQLRPGIWRFPIPAAGLSWLDAAALAVTPGVWVDADKVAATADVAPFVARRLGIVLPDAATALRQPATLDDICIRTGADPAAVRGWSAMRPYQIDGILALVVEQRPYLRFATGIGKTPLTLIALSLLRPAPARALVVTPAKGREAWLRDSAWAGDHRVCAIVGRDHNPSSVAVARRAMKSAQRHVDRGGCVGVSSDLDAVLAAGIANIVVVGWEILADREQALSKVPWDHVVLDEIHYARHWGSNRYKAAKALCKNAKRVWGLTATPQMDTIGDLQSQLELVAPIAWRKWVHVTERQKPLPAFPLRYQHAVWGEYAELDKPGPHPPGSCSYCDESIAELSARLDYWSIKRTRADVAEFLPRRQVVVERVDITELRKRKVKGAEDDNDVDAGAARTRAMQPTERALQTALASAADLKVDYVADRAVELLLEDQKIVVAGAKRAWVLKTTAAIRKRVDRIPRLKRDLWLEGVSGETHDVTARLRVCAEYQDRASTACLVGTMDSLLDTIDLHFTNTVVFAALPYEPGKLGQFIGRFGRFGGWPYVALFIILQDSDDERVERIVIPKLEEAERVGTALASDVDGNLSGMLKRQHTDIIAEMLREIAAADKKSY